MARSPCGKEGLLGSDKAPQGLDIDLVLDMGLDLDPVLNSGLDPGSIASPISTRSVAASGSPQLPVDPVSQVKQFSFPPALEDAPINAAHAKVPSVSKSSLGLRREAIQLYRKSRRELENRLSTTCSVYFEAKGVG